MTDFKNTRKIIAILQARSDSQRLPNKIFLKLGSKSILETISIRLNDLMVQEKWLATTTLKSDDYLAKHGAHLGWKVFRGSQENVLSRFSSIINYSKPDFVIRLTGDNPLIETSSINKLLFKYILNDSPPDYLSDFDNRHYPIGAFPEIFNSKFFQEVNVNLNPIKKFHLSHVTSWLRENVKKVELDLGAQFPRKPGWRWTLDTGDDYKFLTKLNESTGHKLIHMKYFEIVSHIEDNPKLLLINKFVKQKDIFLG